MALKLGDRVRETTIVTGTNNIVLLGAPLGCQPFSNVLSNGDTTYYCVSDPVSGAWEIGLGTYSSAANSLARTTILSSSNTNLAVNFAAGTKDVFCTLPEAKVALIDSSGNLTALTLSGDATGLVSNGTLPVTLANTTVVAGSYPKVTVDSKGRVTAGSNLASSDIVTGLGYTPYNATNPNNYTGLQTITLSGDATGSGSAGLAVTLAASGVTAGTYSAAQLVIDAKGRVVAATNNFAPVPAASTTTPSPSSTTGTYGASLAYARADHVHPSDSSKANLSALALVATSGAYADLTGRPSLATVATSGQYSSLTGAPVLATVATSGLYSDLTNPPTIPVAATVGQTPIVDGVGAVGVSANYAKADHVHPSDPSKANLSALAPVATSGLYSSLTGTPTLASVATTGLYSSLAGTPSISTAGLTGSYLDLTNKPTIPAGTVTSISTSGGLQGGPISSSGTISLAPTAVVPNTYPYATVVVDQTGRITSASAGSPLLAVTAGAGLTGGTITGAGGTIGLANTTVVPGLYTYASVQISADGRITSASSNAPTAFVLSPASSSVLGGVKVGSGLAVDAAGLLSATPTVVPTATSTTLGAVQVPAGANLTLSGGNLSLTSGNVTGALGFTPLASGGLAAIATSGQWADIQSKPTVFPAATASTVTAGSVLIGANLSVASGTLSLTGANVSAALGYTPQNPAGLSAVAVSGSYTDLLNKPAASNYTLPAAGQVSLGGVMIPSTANLTLSAGSLSLSGANVAGALGYTPQNPANLSALAVSGNWSDIAGKPTSFAPVIASSTVLGGVKAGTNITIDGTGVISATPGAYTLPAAGSASLGGVMIPAGANLTLSAGSLTFTNANALAAIGYTPANVASPVLTGIPTAPQAPLNDNSTQIITSAWYVNQLANTTPFTIGASNVTGTAFHAARADHQHQLPAATSTALGGVSIPSGSNLTVTGGGALSLTGANVISALGSTPPTLGATSGLPLATTGSAGAATSAARSDHVHPLDGIPALNSSGKIPISYFDIAALKAALAGATLSESPDQTSVTTVGPTIVDSYLTQFAITSGGQISEIRNGGTIQTDTVTNNVTQLLYYGHKLYQYGSNAWYVRNRNDALGTGVNNYDATTDPRTVVVAPRPSGSVLRIADILENVGFNLYPAAGGGTSQDGGDGSAAGLSAALQYICGNSGMGMFHRFYANSITYQAQTAQQLAADMPGTTFTACMDVFTVDPTDAINLAKLSKGATTGFPLTYLEGTNEPDIDFGNGTFTQAQALAGTQQLYAGVHPLGIKVVAPGIAENGTYGGPGFINTYWGSNLSAINATIDAGNSHDYPNNGTPSSDIDYRTGGVSTSYGGKPVLVTEFDSTLYQGNGFTTSDALQAYWTVLFILKSFYDYPAVAGINIWPLYSYPGYHSPAPNNVPVGAFSSSVKTPRWMANSLRALWQLTGDTLSTKRSFNPTSLGFSTSALNSNERIVVAQNAKGTHFLFVITDTNTLSATPHNITITFTDSVKPTKVEDFSITYDNTANPVAAQTLAGPVSSITVGQRTEIRMLRISH